MRNPLHLQGILNGAPKRIRTANRQNRNLMRYPVAPWVRMNDLNYNTDLRISKHNSRFSMRNILVTYKRCSDIIIIKKISVVERRRNEAN